MATTSASISEEDRSIKRRPLREHAIILLDVLIEAIDINDVNKLALALQVSTGNIYCTIGWHSNTEILPPEKKLQQKIL